MAAKIAIVERGVNSFTQQPMARVYQPENVERLWFFPDGSEYLRYSPHFHMIYSGGFRTNFPLVYGFVVVLEGKLSIKDYAGFTQRKIDVRDQVWFVRGLDVLAQGDYATTIHGGKTFERSSCGRT